MATAAKRAAKRHSLLVNLTDLVDLLRLSEESIRRRERNGLIPRAVTRRGDSPALTGGKLLWRRKDIEDWVSAGCPACRGGAA
jgi:hypothetical protein